MKKRYLILLASLPVFMVFQSYKNGPAANGTRATGAPGDGVNKCTTCHTGGSFGAISVDFALLNANGDTVSEYVAGEDYDVSIAVNHSSGTPAGFGFQMICLKESNDGNYDGWSNPSSNARLSTSSNRHYVEHNAMSTSNTFSVQWSAPEEGTGDVRFYLGANAVNGNNNTSGDRAVLVDFAIAEFVTNDTTDTNANGLHARSGEDWGLFPNPVAETLHLTGTRPVDTFELFDSSGRKLSVLRDGDRIHLQHLPTGRYYLVRNHREVRPIIKH